MVSQLMDQVSSLKLERVRAAARCSSGSCRNYCVTVVAQTRTIRHGFVMQDNIGLQNSCNMRSAHVGQSRKSPYNPQHWP